MFEHWTYNESNNVHSIIYDPESQQLRYIVWHKIKS